MSSHFLTDKSLSLESRFGGWALARRRGFAEPGVEPHYGPDKAMVIEHLDVSLDLDPVARTLVGEARLRLSPLPGAEGPWRLDLDEVVVDEVRAEPAPGGEAGAEPRPLQWTHRDGVLAITPPGPGTQVVLVRWHGSPRRGLYFVGPSAAEPARPPEAWTQCQDEDAHFVLPCVDHPSVKHPWTVRLTVPEGYTAVSNGRCVATHGRTTVWEQPEPMPAYLFTAVALRADVYAEEWDGIPVRYVVPAGTDEAVVRRCFGKTPKMLAFLSGLFGRYPWPRYDQVVVHEFVFGGMENVAATTLTDHILVDERASLDFHADDLVVHELTHQWFGDLLTCQDWSQGWLNEGWATWTENLWYTHDRGQDESDWLLWQHLQSYLGEDGGRYRRPIVTYLFREPIDVFDRHLYEKGALVLQTLRTTLGEQAFWAGVRLYLERHRHQTVHTRHFQRALEDATGRTLDGFFAQWVFGAGHPSLEVGLAHEDGQLVVTVKQTQEGEQVAAAFRFPLLLEVAGARHTLRVERREQSFTLPCPEPPAWVGVDSGLGVLADLKLTAPRSWLAAALKADRGIIGRIRAARALAEEGSPDAVAALVTALREDPFHGVRSEVADLLGARGGARETAALVAALDDADPKVRRRVVAALAETRRPEAVAALVARSGDPSLQVEGEIVKSLGRLRAPEARPRALALLEQRSWGAVLASRGAEALGALRDAAALDPLLAATDADRPTRGRAAACAALAKLGDEVDSTRTAVVERLVQLAEDENFRVQVSAINALGTLRDARARPVLERVHGSAGDGRCRRLAWEALQNVAEGRTTAEGLAGLRGQLEDLVAENRKLRDRVGRLEAKA